MASVVAGISLNPGEGNDKITTTDKITAAYHSDSVTQLTAALLHSASLSAGNGAYYYGIAKSSQSCSVQWYVSYGNSNGYGGNSGATADDLKSPTEVVYKHWTSVLLAENEQTGGFNISNQGSWDGALTNKDEEVYVLNAKRSLMKDRLNKKNWTVVLSGSNTAEDTAQVIKLTDDSNTTKPTATPAGPRYNIVSGSQGTVASASSERTFGWFYPDQGVLVFSGNELSASIPGSGLGNNTSTAVTYNSASQKGFGSAGNSGNTLENADYNTALRFVNCLKDSPAYIQFRNEEDQTSVSYFCRVKAGHGNFSGNPTFVSGSQNEIRQETMKGNPTTFITGVELYDGAGNIVAQGKLSKPLKKNYSSEATIKVNLTY